MAEQPGDWLSATLQLGEWMPDQSAWGNQDPNSTDGTGLDLAQNALWMFDQWKEVRGRIVLGTRNFSVGTNYIPWSSFCDFWGEIYVGTGESRLLGWGETAATFGVSAVQADYSLGGAAYPAIIPYNVGDPRYVSPGWSFTIFGPNVIAASSGGASALPPAMQYRLMNSGNTFAPVVVTPDAPRWAFIGTCKSFLIGANLLGGGSGAYATADAQEYGWSAINDPTTWTPDTTGTTQCGFAFLADEDGIGITGAAYFADFFLLFKDNAIIQVTYQGSPLVWNEQVVASGAFGLGAGAWSASIVRAGRDVYYWSKTGPAVVIGGQYVQFVGEGKFRRYVTDQIRATCSDQGLDPVRGTYIPDYHQIVWVISNSRFPAVGGVPTTMYVVYDIASYRLTSYQKGSDPGHGSIVAPGVVGGSICTQRVGKSLSALDRLRMIEVVGGSAPALNLTGFTDATSSLPMTLRTKIWHPSSDHLCLVQKIRLQWIMDATDNPAGGTLTYPTVSVLVEWSNDSRMLTPNSTTLSTASLDSNGFMIAAEVMQAAAYWRFTVTVPSFSAAQTLREISSLEVLYVEDQLQS
jgi:hypothetical protein